MKFIYTNYKGETEERDVNPIALEWMENPGFGYEAGLFLRAFDNDRKAERSFRIDRNLRPIMHEEGSMFPVYTLYRFPPEQELKVSLDLRSIREVVEKLQQQLEATMIGAEAKFFYRHKATPDDKVTGPVAELPEVVKIHRQNFDVWAVLVED